VSAEPDPVGVQLERVARVLEGHGVTEFAFTGGVAVGVWSTPRQTRDIDVCGVLPAQELDRLLAWRDGIPSGPSEMPDLVRFSVGDWDVDLFVSKSPYDHTCLLRAVPASVDGIEVRVVSAEDLLIHKLIKLRTDRRRILQDVADLRAVVQSQADVLDWEYLRRWLGPDESALLESIARLDDEQVLTRLLPR
jgi:hypothetical protein